jgi:hypothetical protein
MDPVTVLTFNEREQAEPARLKLEQAGIPATIYDERRLQRVWLVREPLAGIRVRVDHKDYERAQEVLRGWVGDEVLRDAVHCLECGSSRVEYPQFTRKFITPGFGALLCLVGLIEREFYCENCHFTWPTKVKIPPDLDLLGWPRPHPVARKR